MTRSDDCRAFLLDLANDTAITEAAGHIHDPGTAQDVAGLLEAAARYIRLAWRLGGTR